MDEPDDNGWTALMFAAYHNRPAVLALLLRHSAKPDPPRDVVDASPLLFACQHKNWACAELLLQYGADVNAQNTMFGSLLHNAVVCGSLDCIEFLLQHGADVNCRNSQGSAPLHHIRGFACLDERAEAMIKVLLAAGADRTLRDNKGKTLADYLAAASADYTVTPDLLAMLAPRVKNAAG